MEYGIVLVVVLKSANNRWQVGWPQVESNSHIVDIGVNVNFSASKPAILHDQIIFVSGPSGPGDGPSCLGAEFILGPSCPGAYLTMGTTWFADEVTVSLWGLSPGGGYLHDKKWSRHDVHSLIPALAIMLVTSVCQKLTAGWLRWWWRWRWWLRCTNTICTRKWDSLYLEYLVQL